MQIQYNEEEIFTLDEIPSAIGWVGIITATVGLVIAGSGNDKRYGRILAKSVAESGVERQIYMTGHVSKEIMQALYRRCRLFITASEIEACPNIAIESLACGCVVIAADQPPLPEIYAGAAQHFAARDVIAIAGCIHRCIQDEDYRSKLSAKALARAAGFSWIRCAQETYDALVNW